MECVYTYIHIQVVKMNWTSWIWFELEQRGKVEILRRLVPLQYKLGLKKARVCWWGSFAKITEDFIIEDVWRSWSRPMAAIFSVGTNTQLLIVKMCCLVPFGKKMKLIDFKLHFCVSTYVLSLHFSPWNTNGTRVITG